MCETPTPDEGTPGLPEHVAVHCVSFVVTLYCVKSWSYRLNLTSCAVRTVLSFNTLRTGAFKLFKCTFPGSKQFKSTFILCLFKYL